MDSNQTEARRYANGGMLCIVGGLAILVLALLVKLDWLISGGIAVIIFGTVVVLYAYSLYRKGAPPS